MTNRISKNINLVLKFI